MMTFRFCAMLSVSSCPTLPADPLRRLLLVRGERHEPTVAPRLTLAEPAFRQPCPAVPLDSLKNGARPVDLPLLRREYPLVEAAIARDVIAYAARRIEVDSLERPHEAPTQRQAFAKRGIDVIDRGVAVGDEAEGLLQQRPMQAAFRLVDDGYASVEDV